VSLPKGSHLVVMALIAAAVVIGFEKYKAKTAP
jgi:hypothetical protein